MKFNNNDDSYANTFKAKLQNIQRGIDEDKFSWVSKIKVSFELIAFRNVLFQLLQIHLQLYKILFFYKNLSIQFARVNKFWIFYF